MRRIMLTMAMVLSVFSSLASAGDEKAGSKFFALGLYDEGFDTGTRSKYFCLTALGPVADDGSPAVGATQFLEFSLWDYLGGTWSRVWPTVVPASCPSCTTQVVPPGGIASGCLEDSRWRLMYIRSGSAVSDSLGATLDWKDECP